MDNQNQNTMTKQSMLEYCIGGKGDDCKFFTFICPKCCRIAHLDINSNAIKNVVEHHSNGITFKYKITPECFDVTCDNCSIQMFECDKTIAPYIADFIKSKAYTSFCCEGHLTFTENDVIKYGPDWGYVAFVDNEDHYMFEILNYILKKLNLQDHVYITTFSNSDNVKECVYINDAIDEDRSINETYHENSTIIRMIDDDITIEDFYENKRKFIYAIAAVSHELFNTEFDPVISFDDSCDND